MHDHTMRVQWINSVSEAETRIGTEAGIIPNSPTTSAAHVTTNITTDPANIVAAKAILCHMTDLHVTDHVIVIERSDLTGRKRGI